MNQAYAAHTYENANNFAMAVNSQDRQFRIPSSKNTRSPMGPDQVQASQQAYGGPKPSSNSFALNPAMASTHSKMNPGNALDGNYSRAKRHKS